ncbi:hypothetical protein F2Q69_00013151 [Brassica cretica]|uniref:Uncharacterized protein n=1 Tax=Brassica cretica TaxID=69181 RepID=A0A8S9QPF6_BRACR|nr:hypothetical protein F2Q69_00013151 [Brassica cretica]
MNIPKFSSESTDPIMLVGFESPNDIIPYALKRDKALSLRHLGFSDLRQTLKYFSEDFRKTSQNTFGRLLRILLASLLMHFMLEDFPRNLQEVFYPIFFRSESDFGKLLRKLLEDYWKTLGRLLGKSSNVFYARRLPVKSSESLPKSSVQGGTK